VTDQRSLRLRGMYWGIIITETAGSGNWLLLEQSIRENPMESIEQMEAAFNEEWVSLQDQGCYMIRLNLSDKGRPTDMMFAWSTVEVEADGIMPYDSDFEKSNNVIVGHY